MKAAMPYHLLQRWKVYRQIAPWGDDWQQTAVIAAAAMNPHVKRQRKLDDFMPRPPKPKQTPDQIRLLLGQAFGVKHGHN